MTAPPRRRMIRPTSVTWVAIVATLATIAFCAAFLAVCYPALPDILPVHFNRANRANGWQYKTAVRVLMPVLVQGALVAVLSAIAALLLAREHDADDRHAEDLAAASTAAEAIALFALIWVVVQACGATALVTMWQRGRGGLGAWYGYATWLGVALSIVVAIRAHVRLGRPTPRPFVAQDWWFGHLYHNGADPALFVPARDGSRWTLNFGRGVAAALIALLLAVGIVVPATILGLLLR